MSLEGFSKFFESCLYAAVPDVVAYLHFDAAKKCWVNRVGECEGVAILTLEVVLDACALSNVEVGSAFNARDAAFDVGASEALKFVKDLAEVRRATFDDLCK